MEQTVYGDILFFVNFCMDFQCLFLTAKLMRRSFYVWRSVAASALGAFYACAALFLGTQGIWAFLADCGVCLAMCLLSFGGEGKGPRRVLIAFGIYFGVSFAVGGVMSGIASLLSHVEMPLGDGGELSSSAFFLLAALGGAVTFLWGRFCQRRARGRRAVLTLEYSGKTLTLDCMVDTANLLRDPVSGRLVALVERSAVKDFWPSEVLKAEEAGAAGLATLAPELARRIRLVPASTATGSGLLFALSPDGALLDAGQGPRPVELLVAPVSLAVDTDDYTVLLPAELIVD